MSLRIMSFKANTEKTLLTSISSHCIGSVQPQTYQFTKNLQTVSLHISTLYPGQSGFHYLITTPSLTRRHIANEEEEERVLVQRRHQARLARRERIFFCK